LQLFGASKMAGRSGHPVLYHNRREIYLYDSNMPHKVNSKSHSSAKQSQKQTVHVHLHNPRPARKVASAHRIHRSNEVPYHNQLLAHHLNAIESLRNHVFENKKELDAHKVALERQMAAVQRGPAAPAAQAATPPQANNVPFRRAGAERLPNSRARKKHRG
jgi:hypothetical protein